MLTETLPGPVVLSGPAVLPGSVVLSGLVVLSGPVVLLGPVVLDTACRADRACRAVRTISAMSKYHWAFGCAVTVRLITIAFVVMCFEMLFGRFCCSPSGLLVVF